MLELKNIFFTVNGINILEDISLTFEQGRIYVITGAASSGKSLLMKVLGGITKPTSGFVLLDGESLYTPDQDRCIKNNIGFVFQDGVFLSNLSIYDNLLLPVKYLCPSHNLQEVNKNIIELFERFHINPAMLSKRPSDVSYAAKKLISFVRAAIIHPDIYMINMPLFNLDFGDVKRVIEFLGELSKEHKTVILTSNNRPLIEKLADEMILLVEGKVSHHLPKTEFIGSDNQAIKEFIEFNLG